MLKYILLPFFVCLTTLCLPFNAEAQRTSPFEPVATGETTYVVDVAPGLDTGCTFRGGGPLIIPFNVTRFVGDTSGTGVLLKAATLTNDKIISQNATIRLPAWDIDGPEHDRVTVNGHVLGLLKGANGLWNMNEFTIPVEWLRFPKKGVNGSTPTPVNNEIKIDIDISSPGQSWCMQVDWIEVSFEAMSPLLLVHGTNAQSDTWVPDVTDFLTSRSVPHSNNINLVANGTIDGNARLLKGRVNALAKSFGAEKVHLIAHSKGGLDSRRFLGQYYTPTPGAEAKVLSLYTISTPHHGTIISDLTRANRVHNAFSNDPDVQAYLNRETYTPSSFTPVDPALSEQTVENMLSFNRNNPFSGNGVQFHTISADADLNNDGQISGNESSPLIPNIFGVPSLMYRLLGNVETITVTRGSPGIFQTRYQVTPNPTGAFQENDLVVTTTSARHPAATEILFADRNHSNIKDAATIQTILNRIQADYPVQ